MAALVLKPNAVVVAPPGAGKTTRVAPALLDQPWCKGKVWLLSPRRLAARAAAERIADAMGEAVGARAVFATPLDSKPSAATRLLVRRHGRASCWERACHYAYISGDAGTVKKKYSQTTYPNTD